MKDKKRSDRELGMNRKIARRDFLNGVATGGAMLGAAALSGGVGAETLLAAAALDEFSREALNEREGRRWTDIVSFTINMEQIGDIIERVLQDIEDKKVKKNRSFSEAGMAEIVHLHERLLSNLRLAMSVFLDGHVRDAKRLLEEKAHFRDLEHEYAANHIARLRENTTQSIETSSLHLDLISDLKRINSHICSIAYPILEQAGVLAKTRLKEAQAQPVPSPGSDPTGAAAGRESKDSWQKRKPRTA